MDAGAVTPELLREWSLPDLGIGDHTLGDIFLARKAPDVDGALVAQPTASLGRLGRLPLELLTDVVLALDVLAVAAFRRVNRMARRVVGSVPQYARLAQHCAHLLRAIEATDAGHFSLRTLHDTLCTQRCAACGQFGGYLYIITCRRVCYPCLTNDRRFLPLLGKHASALRGCTRKALRALPHIRSIRGRYADGGHRCDNGFLSPGRISLWDRATVLAVGTTAAAPVPERPDRHNNDTRRFMAIVPVPYFEPPSREARWGVYCAGCRSSVAQETHFRKMYSTQGFLEHVVRYGAIQMDDWTGRLKHVPTEQ